MESAHDRVRLGIAHFSVVAGRSPAEGAAFRERANRGSLNHRQEGHFAAEERLVVPHHMLQGRAMVGFIAQIESECGRVK